MLARNVTRKNLTQAAKAHKIAIVDYRPDGKTGARFRLSPIHKRTPAGRVAAGGFGPYSGVRSRVENPFGPGPATVKERRIASVCWHGHREFFRSLLKIRPDARIQTTLLGRGNRFNMAHGNLTGSVRWYTAENFETVFPQTGDLNIGSQMYPLLMADACHCDE